MKLDARRAESFLDNPGNARVVLLYGDDAGLIRMRAAHLTRVAAGSDSDPFRVVELARDQSSQLNSEAISLPLTGGRRVIVVRDATDAWALAVKDVLSRASPALVVLEGAGLTVRSKLRALVEASPGGMALGCYPDDARTMRLTIKNAFASAGATISEEAVDWALARLGADRALNAQEVGRLVLYTGPGGSIDVDDVRYASSDLAELSIDDAWLAATAGQADKANRALEVSFAAGATATGILRAGIIHFRRLFRCAVVMKGGVPGLDAVKAARPPVSSRSWGAIVKALGIFDADEITGWLKQLLDAELACKQTVAPAESICRRILASAAKQSRRDS